MTETPISTYPRQPAGKGFLLAHFSDPHLTVLQDIQARDLLNKRALGYRSWRHRRRHEHLPKVLAALLSDLRAIDPDHIVITGDLTHLGMAKEFRQVTDWLPSVGKPTDVTIIPGNHDRYLNEPWDKTFALWTPYMASDDSCAHVSAPAAENFFPSLRIRGDMALIGVSSARPSAPFLAIGSIGERQLDRLTQLLYETGKQGLCRILLIHHPPVPGSIQWRKRLTDSRQLAALIANQGVEMVLHGHAHRASRGWLETPLGRAPVFGVRSASAIGRRPQSRAQYHLYRLVREHGGWRLILCAREYAPDRNGFVLAEEWHGTLRTARTQASSHRSRAQ